jgi:hypothetical protein
MTAIPYLLAACVAFVVAGVARAVAAPFRIAFRAA